MGLGRIHTVAFGVALVVLAGCSGRGSSSPTATPAAATSTATTAPSPTPSGQVFAYMQEVAPVLHRSTYRVDQELPESGGILFARPDSTEVEVWSRPEGGPVHVPGIWASGDGSVIGYEHYLIERDTGRTLILPGNLIARSLASTVGAIPGNTPVLATSVDRNVVIVGGEGPEFGMFVGNLDSLAITRVDLAGETLLNVQMSPDGRRVLAMSAGASDATAGDRTLHILEPGSGMLVRVGTMPADSELRMLPGDFGFQVLESRPIVRQWGSVYSSGRWYDWDGNLVQRELILEPDVTILDPQAQRYAQVSDIAQFRFVGEPGDFPRYWPRLTGTVIRTLDGNEDVLAVRGGMVTAWTHDGTRVVVVTDSNDAALVDLDGRVLASMFYQPGQLRTPTPSPVDADLLVTAHGFVDVGANRQTNVRFPANAMGTSGWLYDGTEAVFAWADSGGYAPSPPQRTVIPLEIDLAPFGPLVALVVEGTGDCLHLRAGSGTDTHSYGCYPDGTSVAVTDPPVDPTSPDPTAYSGHFYDDGPFWLYVTVPDGNQGWMRSDFLGWP